MDMFNENTPNGTHSGSPSLLGGIGKDTLKQRTGQSYFAWIFALFCLNRRVDAHFAQQLCRLAPI